MKIVDVLYKLIDRGREGKNIGISTGIPKLDKYTGGLQKGIYTLIFGQSGSGKTSYVLYSHIYRPLKDNPTKDINIVYYSLEMSAEILLAKLLCLYIYEEFGKIIPYTNLLSWQEILDDDAYHCVIQSKKWLESIQKRLVIFDKSLSAKSFYATMMPLLEKWGDFIPVDDGKRTVYVKHNEDQIVNVVIDHLGLSRPSESRNKKQEMDEISSYAVGFREKCQVSFSILMQENRNTGDIDRIKADMAEPTVNDLKDTGNPQNDCDICIAIYNPVNQKIKTYRGYKIIIDNAPDGAFEGLRDRYRAGIILKNRYGISAKLASLNFFGEIGLFRELPRSNQITDYSPYLNLTELNKLRSNIEDNKATQEKPCVNHLKFKF